MKPLTLTISLFLLTETSLFAHPFSGVIEKELESSNGFQEIKVRLNKDQTYTAKYQAPGSVWSDQGTWQIQADTLALIPKSCKSGIEVQSNSCSESLGKATCIPFASLYYNEALKCTSKENKDVIGAGSPDIIVSLQSSPVVAGTERSFHGEAVVTMGMVKAKTTTNVKIRSAPSTSAKIIEYVQDPMGSMGPDHGNMPYMPPGTELRVVARTKEKKQVEKWNNYWYLVNINFQEEVWVFGEFVKIDK
jgi:hypothetical protein